jgi:hypothetical protein
LAPAQSSRKKHATLTLLLSDTHFDEVVLPEEVGGLNAYNRQIAEFRLKLWAENATKMARHYLSGVTYDGVVVMLGGDIFSGDIHEELAQTNEDTMLGSLLHWSEQISAALLMFADEFGKVHVPCVIGNHGRMSRKPRMKLRAKTNFDWLLGKMIERHLSSDKRFTFQISENADTMVNMYGHGHLLTHGDQVSGGGGVGGIWGTLIGVFMIRLVDAGLVYMSFPSQATEIMIGAIMTAATGASPLGLGAGLLGLITAGAAGWKAVSAMRQRDQVIKSVEHARDALPDEIDQKFTARLAEKQDESVQKIVTKVTS